MFVWADQSHLCLFCWFPVSQSALITSLISYQVVEPVNVAFRIWIFVICMRRWNAFICSDSRGARLGLAQSATAGKAQREHELPVPTFLGIVMLSFVVLVVNPNISLLPAKARRGWNICLCFSVYVSVDEAWLELYYPQPNVSRELLNTV